MSMVNQVSTALRSSGLGRWYFGRDSSEQRIIAGLCAFALLLLLWAFVWKPVYDWQVVEVNRQNNAQQLLDWVKVNKDNALLASRANPANQGNRALIPPINKTARAHKIKIGRLQPESNGVVSVLLQGQNFNDIINWVAQLEENNGISVERANFDAQENPGYVNVQIRLN